MMYYNLCRHGLLSVMVGLVVVLALTPLNPATQASPALAQDNVVTVEGDIITDTIWTPDQQYLLAGGVFVRPGVTLTILPGTSVVASQRSFLVIDRGAQIMALGDPTAPIVFTTDEPEGQRTPGYWGGLVINGYAPVNIPGGEGLGTGGTGRFGGNDPHDSSGVLRYVRVEFGGLSVDPAEGNQLNCIAFQGVGDGTVVDHIQVSHSGDDGIYFNGGTVNVKYLLSTANADDSLDWEAGWTGKVQFVVIQQSADEADHGIEADNSAADHDLVPRSNPTMYNVTLIGDPRPGPGSTQGILLRRGTAATLRNFIVVGFKQAGLEIRDQATFHQMTQGSLSLGSFIFFNNNPNVAPEIQSVIGGFANMLETDPHLVDPFNLQNPDFRPRVGSPARDESLVAAPPEDGFFEPVRFIGGVDPFNDWTKQGWTVFGSK